MVERVAIGLMVVCLGACSAGTTSTPHEVTIESTMRVVPSAGLPDETPPQNSNNNLDVVTHEGRVYLAWRTSPDHFAGPETVIHVVSSEDEATWRFEASFSIGTDLREPRLLSFEGGLFLYVSVLGTDRFAFEPQGVMVSERLGDADWSALEDIPELDSRIAWRTKVVDGVPMMTAYDGGENIYFRPTEGVHVELLTTSDGRRWTPLDPDFPTVYSGGGSETAFEVDRRGGLYAVVRTEAWDDNGMGSQICEASPGALADWTCVNDPRKYDSPLMFRVDGELYLVGRRQVENDGIFGIMSNMFEEFDFLRFLQDHAAYSSSPKRCALWHVVREELRIDHVMDLPSNGDTCFAGIVRTEEEGLVHLYDYSSDIDAEPLDWNEGQAGPTFIYRHVLRFR